MKALPSQRIRERLRRLQERVPAARHESMADHDFERLTSARREHFGERTFFLGEIWWADRFALGDHRPYREGSSHVPALVTRREERPWAPVEMAPPALGTRAAGDALVFAPGEALERVRERSAFALAYRRAVSREELGGHLATLGSTDKQRLAAELDRERQRKARGTVA